MASTIKDDLRHRVLPILRKLNPQEFEKLKLFAKSEYFNGSLPLHNFLNELSPYYPKFAKSAFTESFLKQKKYLFAGLLPVCENFLKQIHFENKRNEQALALILEFEKREIGKLFKIRSEELLKVLDSQDNIAITNYLNKHILLNSVTDYEILYKGNKNDIALWNLTMKDSQSYSNLFEYFFLEAVFGMNNFYVRFNRIKADSSKFAYTDMFQKFLAPNISDIFKYLKTEASTSNHKKILELIELVHYMHVDNSKIIEMFPRAKNMLLECVKFMNIDLRYHIFTELLYFVYKLVLNNKNMYDLEFEFYDIYFENKGFQTDNKQYISVHEFRHLLSRIVSTKKFDWGNDVLFKNHFDCMPGEFKKILKAIFYSHYYIYKKSISKNNTYDNNLSKLLEELSKFKPEHYILERDIKQLRAILLFELGDYDLSLAVLGQIRKFTERKNFPTLQKDAFINMVKLMTKFIKIVESDKYNKKEKDIYLKQLKNKIKNSGIVAANSWMINKIDKMIS